MNVMVTAPRQRRRFFGQLLGGVAAWAGFPAIAAAADDADGGDNRQHDAWMTRIRARHRQLFHATAHGETPMLMARNFLDVYGSVYGARPGQAAAVIGIHGTALPIGLLDSVWEKYELGRGNNITDPATREPAKRNVFVNDTDLGINRVMERGVTLLVCNVALTLSARRLAAAQSVPEAEVYADLRAAVLPGAIVVPALVVALNRAQEKGFTYVRAS